MGRNCGRGCQRPAGRQRTDDDDDNTELNIRCIER
jgi:hypothetical protein